MKAISNRKILFPALFAPLALAAVLGGGSVRAQDSADAPAVHVRFRTLGTLPASEGGDVYYGSEKKDIAIQADENVRSAFFDYKGPVTLTLYRLKTNPDKTVEHVNVAEVDLTAKGGWPLLLISPGPKPGIPQILAVPDDLASFPPNTYRFVNRSKSPCAGMLGGDKFVLAPDEIKLLNPPPADAEHRAVMAQVTGGAQRRLIYSSNWVVRTGVRTMVFINEGGGDFGVARRIVEGTDILATEMKKTARQ